MGLHNELPVYKASYDLLIGIFEGLVGNARRYSQPASIPLLMVATVENSLITAYVS
jgi:hypothetical protein